MTDRSASPARGARRGLRPLVRPRHRGRRRAARGRPRPAARDEPDAPRGGRRVRRDRGGLRPGPQVGDPARSARTVRPADRQVHRQGARRRPADRPPRGPRRGRHRRAFDRPLDDVKWAGMLVGDVGRLAGLARDDALADAALALFHPLKFMLASPAEDAAEIITRLGPEVWVEDKYDGIRAQLHKRGREVRLYSRDLHDISARLPGDRRGGHRPRRGTGSSTARSSAGATASVLPFIALQARLGRKTPSAAIQAEVPVIFVAFDVLAVGPGGGDAGRAAAARAAVRAARPARRARAAARRRWRAVRPLAPDRRGRRRRARGRLRRCRAAGATRA